MHPAMARLIHQADSCCGLGKLGLTPTTGPRNHHQPSSSAESSESPRTGLRCQHAGAHSVPLDAAGTSVPAAPAAADFTSSVMAIKQGLAHLAPSQLAELQYVLQQQRLQRQEQDLLPLPAPQTAAPQPAVTAAQPLLAGHGCAASAADAAANAISIMRQVAAAANALATSGFAHDEAARVAFLQAAAAHLLMQHQQQYSAPAPAAATGSPAMPQHVHQPHPGPCWQQQQQQQQHPGVTSCKLARNTVRRSRGCFNTSVLYDVPAVQQQQQHAWQVLAEYEAGAAPGCSHGALPQFAMAPAVRAALLQQLHQLQEAEQQQGARRSKGKAAVAANQRKSARAHKAAKRDWDATNNTSQQQQHMQDSDSGSGRSSSPAVPHAPGAAAASSGSADANNGSSATAGAAAAAAQQQQQPLAVKRVRFALADDNAGGSGADESDHEDGEQPRHVVVRRVGPRAQARKRMHKRSARRRRPQRAPLC